MSGSGETQISAKVWARAGLLGNPSDGYGGKTLSVTVANFWAEVSIVESKRLTILADSDASQGFDSLSEFVRHLTNYGYYGMDRLLRAALKRFALYGQDRFPLRAGNFTMRATTNIPRGVGLAGSSAIVVAALRALCAWYQVRLRPDVLASLALAVERDELGIPAGLQDRVVQSYEGLVFMDFSPAAMHDIDGWPVGVYERLDPSRLPPLYLAYARDAAEPTEVTHADLQRRFQERQPDVIDGLNELAALAQRGRDAIVAGQSGLWAEWFNRNFDIRRRICRLNPHHVAMVERARSVGASAKYCGSGGAIVGTYDGADMLSRLADSLASLNCLVAPLHIGQFPGEK